MLTLEKGRPADFDSRLPKEQRVYRFLESMNVSWERVDHAPAMTMEACQEVDRVLGAKLCKNLLLCNRQCTDFYLLLMPGDKPFKTKDLSKEIGSSRLSFADGKYMEEFLDITPGSLSVLGLINDREKRVRLLIDEDLLQAEYLCCHPCINTSSLKIKTADMLTLLLPAMGHSWDRVHLDYPEETPDLSTQCLPLGAMLST